jgi:phage tail sheath gpL-like
MAQTTITLTHLRADDYKGKATDSPRTTLGKVINLLTGAIASSYQATSLSVSQDPASATVTLAGVGGEAATGAFQFTAPSGPTTATLNGVAFVQTTGDEGERATELAAQITASTNPAVSGVVTATLNVDEVVITAVTKGTSGNAITLAASGTGLSVSAATLGGGVNGLVTVTINGTAEATTTTNLTDAAAATLAASEINANATQSALVTASASGAEVTITANAAGESGNAITLTSTSATGTATASAAKLSGGTSTIYTL